jgi:succinate dehydrogenase cytochrome b subunit
VVKNSSPWVSRNMGILGTIIFVFLIIHLKDFWAQMHWGGIPTQTYDGTEYKDLYSLVSLAFGQGWYVALYTVSMVMLAFHLWHGFASAFQTLGLNHIKYSPAIKFIGRVYSIVIPALFAWIPISMFYYPLS